MAVVDGVGDILGSAKQLETGEVTSQALVESCLHKIDTVGGQGGAAFLKVHRNEALEQAAQVDALRRIGAPVPQFAGIPIAVKDNFDEQGQATTAGSVVLQSAPLATRDALAVSRLRAAGFIVIGRTNMTEFAFSGLGLNPHYGTPLSPYGREEERISGGSSSGTAVAVADGMAIAGIGTDTGGSCRIPAAFCGLVGFRPTQSRIPLDGVVPLSMTLDAVGPLGRSVSCCAILDAIMAGEDIYRPAPLGPVSGLRLAIPETLVLEGLDEVVQDGFNQAVVQLERAGACVREVKASCLEAIPEINAKGGFAAAESWAYSQRLIERDRASFDTRVVSRMARGAEQSAADYIGITEMRRQLIAEFETEVSGFDAVIFPTTPIVAPRLADLEDDADYTRINLSVLRNPTVANMLDRPAISLPVKRDGHLPVGVMLMGHHGRDKSLFGQAMAVEAVLGVDH